MIDANSQFFAILTQVGEAKQANADALGRPWLITEMGLGDANGTDPVPDRLQTRLINEWRRRPLNQLKIDPINPAVIIAEQIIPADEGGKWIREIGLYDAGGDLVAVANCAPSYKPVLSQGSGRTQIVRMNLIVTGAGNVTLKIDPAVVLATREFVEQRIMEELYKLDSKQSVRVATTANIALTGLRTVDGVALSAGDRVLVKNQTVAKDNGIYVTSATAWTRAPDADSNAEVTSALVVSVEQGATLADSRWQLVTDGVIVLGTTALAFQNVTQGYASIFSPAFLGTPTADTATPGTRSRQLATTEFVQQRGHQYSGFTQFGGSLAGILAHVGGLVHCSGASANAYSLPNAKTNKIPLGAVIRVQNWGIYNLSLSVQGADKMQENIDGLWTATTRSIPPDSYVDCTYIGTDYWLLTGTGVFGKTRPFASLLGAVGYQKLPSGLIMQWFTASFDAPYKATAFNLPIAFPGQFFGCSVSLTGSAIYDSAGQPFVAGMPNGLGQVLLQSNYTASQSAVRVLAFGI